MPVIRIPARTPKAGKAVKGPGKRPRKGPKQPALQSRRDSSSSLSSPADLSGDDGYSALEDLSESDEDDEDEEHVNKVEENHIIIEHKRPAMMSSPRPNSDFAPEDEMAIDADDDRDSSDDDQNLFGDSTLNNVDEDSGSDNDNGSSWNGFSSEIEAPYPDLPFAGVDEQSGTGSATPVERRVRFTGVPESDSDSEETEEDHADLFPDIFVEQSSLDPTFRREIEHSDPDMSDSSYSFWDQNGDDGDDDSDDSHEGTGRRASHPPTYYVDDVDLRPEFGLGSPAPQSMVPDVPVEEEDEESDGYESDGETTEEDEPVPIRRKALEQTPVRRPAASNRNGEGKSDSSDADATVGNATPQSASTPARKRPIMVLNPHTRKMMIFYPQKKRRWVPPGQDYFQLSLSRGALSAANQSAAGMQGADMSMFQELFLDNAHWGPNDGVPFVLDPTLSLPLFGRPSSSGSSLPGEEDGDEGESALNLEDFIQWDEPSDGDDNMDDADEGNTDGMNTPSRRPSVATSGASDAQSTQAPVFNHFLNHLTNNGNIVGAFRLNQNNQKLILNGEVTQESLAFGNPLFNGTLRGIKTGNLGGAATPLTPERRHKTKTKSPSEALGSKKRKASGILGAQPNQLHKRQRSISDVGGMHI